jgi:hypothetical protein
VTLHVTVINAEEPAAPYIYPSRYTVAVFLSEAIETDVVTLPIPCESLEELILVVSTSTII